jgi:hypothetical protein
VWVLEIKRVFELIKELEEFIAGREIRDLEVLSRVTSEESELLSSGGESARD